MAALRHDDRQPCVSVVPQRRYQPRLVDAREAVARAQRVVAAGPERGEIGRGAARAECSERMLGIVQPLRVERVVPRKDQVMQHPDYLTLQSRQCTRRFKLDHVLVQRRHDLGQRRHERWQRRRHVTDERWRRHGHHMPEHIVEQMIRVLLRRGRIFRYLDRGKGRLARRAGTNRIEVLAGKEVRGMLGNAPLQVVERAKVRIEPVQRTALAHFRVVAGCLASVV